MNLSKLQELVKDREAHREAQHAAVCGVTKSQIGLRTEQQHCLKTFKIASDNLSNLYSFPNSSLDSNDQIPTHTHKMN